MKTALSIALFASFGFAAHARADNHLVFGKEQGVRAAFCTQQSDAEAIARADSEEGIPKAREVMAARECGIGTAYVQPVRITYSGKTERGATVRVIEVEIEMIDNSKHKFYMVADVEIDGLIET